MACFKHIAIIYTAVLTGFVLYFYATSHYNQDKYKTSPSKVLYGDTRHILSGFRNLHNPKSEATFIAVTHQNKTADIFEDESDIPCTFGLFRKYFKEYEYIPTGGNWVKVNESDRYQPRICKYKYAIQESDFMARCFEKAHLKHVVTTGDSNGGFNYNALIQLLKQLSCQRGRVDAGGADPSKQYYTFYNRKLVEFLQTRRRFCGTVCTSKQTTCKLSADSSTGIFLEQITSMMTLDDSIQLAIPNNKFYADHLADTWALTNQEFYLRYFLKDRYPDLLIVTLPFNHDKLIPLGRLELDIRHFTFLVEYYVPQSTKVFYIPSFSEFESPRTKAAFINRKYEGLLAADKINNMNHLLYRILADDIKDNLGRTYGFIDLWEMSRSRESWSKDGVHMQPTWYLNAMSMFWETFCNSVNNDDF